MDGQGLWRCLTALTAEGSNVKGTEKVAEPLILEDDALELLHGQCEVIVYAVKKLPFHRVDVDEGEPGREARGPDICAPGAIVEKLCSDNQGRHKDPVCGLLVAIGLWGEARGEPPQVYDAG